MDPTTDFRGESEVLDALPTGGVVDSIIPSILVAGPDW